MLHTLKLYWPSYSHTNIARLYRSIWQLSWVAKLLWFSKLWHLDGAKLPCHMRSMSRFIIIGLMDGLIWSEVEM